MKIVFLLMIAIAGVAIAVQPAANSGLGQRIGLGAALLINSVIVLVACIALWLSEGGKMQFFPEETSWKLYLGGILGFIIIFVMAYVFPKVGGAYMIAVLVLGQGVAALAIDHF